MASVEKELENFTSLIDSGRKKDIITFFYPLFVPTDGDI